jgi:hypothetical protein
MDRNLSRDQLRRIKASIVVTAVISLIFTVTFMSITYLAGDPDRVSHLADHIFLSIIDYAILFGGYIARIPFEVISLSVSGMLTAVLAVLYYKQSRILDEQTELEEAKHDPSLRILDYRTSDKEGYIEVKIQNIGGGRAENLQVVCNLFVGASTEEEVSSHRWEKIDDVYLENTKYYDYGIKEEKSPLVSSERLSKTSDKVTEDLTIGGVIKQDCEDWYSGTPALGTEIYRESEKDNGVLRGIFTGNIRGSGVVRTGRTNVPEVINDLRESGLGLLAIEFSVEYKTITGETERDYLLTKIIPEGDDLNMDEIIQKGPDRTPIDFFGDMYPINKPGKYVGDQPNG